MLGDILLINDGHKKAAKQIVERLKAIQNNKIIVAIGGESGTGKSELAHVVARLLKDQGEPAKLLHIDDYYKTSPQERGAWRKKHGIESIGYTEYDWEAINRNLAEFRADANDVVMPCIDMLTDQEDRLQVLEREHQVVLSLRPLANLLVTPVFDIIEA